MRPKMKIILVISLVLNIVLIFSTFMISDWKKGALIEAAASSLFKNDNNMDPYLKKKKQKNITIYTKYYQTKKNIFDSYQHRPNEIIFLGDSMTDYYEWGESFRNERIINRGISGDTTFGVLNRIDEVIQAQPKKLFIMIGINDMLAQQELDTIETNYKEIVNTIRKQSPETNVYIQSVLPVNQKLHGNYVQNDAIYLFNRRLETLASLHDIPFINLYPKFLENGQLNPDLTYDGLHLNGKGYKIWKETVNAYVKQ
ncbi:GDSL-type esterase/lipase family protein [Pseudalkalibacillus caeni]|uniref:SGNH hydrolase-type esterase domain-containing protein n=1 Tax=Exobacillus caeni TaxID=2574798 RepID=A0A5R9F9Y0_9BACL|nr:GDSL-type esterase/lipase family protein [Pseudalkalibacillus caeni]TLS39319.1 hypothetical protein FCL54_03170 [Pseudalkalibacillus caeni]